MKNKFLTLKCFIGAIVIGIVIGVVLAPILRSFLEPKLTLTILGAFPGVGVVFYCGYFDKKEEK